MFGFFVELRLECGFFEDEEKMFVCEDASCTPFGCFSVGTCESDGIDAVDCGICECACSGLTEAADVDADG